METFSINAGSEDRLEGGVVVMLLIEEMHRSQLFI